jgi:hypothetical protein
MARTKQTRRFSTGGDANARRALITQAARDSIKNMQNDTGADVSPRKSLVAEATRDSSQQKAPMARTKQTLRFSTGGDANARRSLITQAARDSIKNLQRDTGADVSPRKSLVAEPTPASSHQKVPMARRKQTLRFSPGGDPNARRSLFTQVARDSIQNIRHDTGADVSPRKSLVAEATRDSSQIPRHCPGDGLSIRRPLITQAAPDSLTAPRRKDSSASPSSGPMTGTKQALPRSTGGDTEVNKVLMSPGTRDSFIRALSRRPTMKPTAQNSIRSLRRRQAKTDIRIRAYANAEKVDHMRDRGSY